MKFTFDWKEYARLARAAGAEGCVLLKNDNNALPIRSGECVSVFGRIAFDYYKSGTGSGGMVNVPYAVSVIDAFKEASDISLNEELLQVYIDWMEEHPFKKGEGWAMDPWCQDEMPLDDEVVRKAAANSDVAVVVIGRTAGEEKDNSTDEGSYLLTATESDVIAKVSKAFKRCVVCLNVGNIIDMKWVDEYNPSSVLYLWQGGMEGGHAAFDVLTGKVNPCGRLADTVARDITDYPSYNNYGDPDCNFYEEDIYVGYRYFETAAKDKVMYPFGFGLSYTTFKTQSRIEIDEAGGNINVISEILNTGDYGGKEVVQVYCEGAEGVLCKPSRELVAFAKTDVLAPGESTTITCSFKIKDMASFDDGAYTGQRGFVLEKGEYGIYAGCNVREAERIGTYTVSENILCEACNKALMPVKDLSRTVIRKNGDKVEITKEKAPKRDYDLGKLIESGRPQSKSYEGDKGYKFVDYANGKIDVDTFLSQLSDEDLICMTRGEGMNSPKVTPGIAGSFGGVTKNLQENFGIPIAGCSDGPSGIRMDCGTESFLLPNGTLLACSFNVELIGLLYEYLGRELRKNKIDALLGPGLNIHRFPLNGRNFEYFSEDPFLTGACAVAQLKAFAKYKVTGTVKHFATNNQEIRRHFVDAVVSERALREIYLKGFEMAVREGKTLCMMTTYGPLNGTYTGSNYELNTTVLRNDWGYKGLTMTDWWAKLSEDGKPETGDIKNTTAMVRAQNDVYMVTGDSQTNVNNDNSAEGLERGLITRGELLRNAANILYVVKNLAVTDRLINGEDEIEELNRPQSNDKIRNRIDDVVIEGDSGVIPTDHIMTDRGCDNQLFITFLKEGDYEAIFTVRSKGGELAQTSLTYSENNVPRGTITVQGTDGQWVERKMEIPIFTPIKAFVSLYFAQSGMEIKEIRLERKTTK